MDSLKTYGKERGQHAIDSIPGGNSQSLSTAYCLPSTDNLRLLSTNKGIALLMALIITLVVFLMIMSTLYMVTTSTTVSGAGKRYATAAEAADGAVEVMKDTISLIMAGEKIETFSFLQNTTGLKNAVITENNPTEVKLNLAGTGLGTTYEAKINVERHFAKGLKGARIEFGRSGVGGGGSAVYFRINVIVTGPGNTKAETSALYRHV